MRRPLPNAPHYNPLDAAKEPCRTTLYCDEMRNSQSAMNSIYANQEFALIHFGACNLIRQQRELSAVMTHYTPV